MKASIVLPNMNGSGWIEDSINSLYAQTEQDFELIVVDNGSTDESLALVRSYVGRPGYTLIENGENTGFSHAVNQGIRLAKAPYVLLWNNDAFARPDMLAQLLASMERHPDAFGIQCLMLRHADPTKADDAGDYISIFGWALKRGDGLDAAKYTKEKKIFSACGGASMYRRAVLDEIGLFDENFFAYFEDVDISWRAVNAGYRNYLCPAASCTHIAGATTGGAKGARYNDFKSVQSGRNSLLLPYKNQPLLMLLVNAVFQIPGYLVKLLVFHLRGYGKAWNKGMKEGFALLGKVEKPKFRLKNLPNYFWAEWQMIIGAVMYVDYRVRRLFAK